MFNVKELLESSTFAPRERYVVRAQDTYGEWHSWPTNERPQKFVRLENAKHILDSIRAGEDILDSFISKETTVFFSDLATTEPHSITEHTLLLV